MNDTPAAPDGTVKDSLTVADLAKLDALYPILSRLADPTNTRLGCSVDELANEGVGCYLDLRRLAATLTDPEPSPPAAPDVAELVQDLRDGVTFYNDGCAKVTSIERTMDRAADTLTRLAADLARVERERDEARIELERARSLLFHAQDDLRSGDEGNLSREIDQFWNDTRKQSRAAIAARGR